LKFSESISVSKNRVVAESVECVALMKQFAGSDDWCPPGTMSKSIWALNEYVCVMPSAGGWPCGFTLCRLIEEILNPFVYRAVSPAGFLYNPLAGRLSVVAMVP